MRPSAHRLRRGFTLIELLTVIAIIGVLAAIIIPTVGKVRETARTAQCVSNQRQIAMALLAYAGDNRNSLPKGAPGSYADNFNQANSWNLEIMPYLLAKVSTDANTAIAQRKAQTILTCPVFIANRRPTDEQLDNGFFGVGLNLAMGHPDQFPLVRTGMERNAVWTRMNLTRFANPARVVVVGDSDQTTSPGTRYQMLPSTTGDGGASIRSGAGLRHGSRAVYAFADGHAKTLTPEEAFAVLRP